LAESSSGDHQVEAEMTKNCGQRFSVDIKESGAVSEIEQVRHPMLKQILEQVLVEENCGSSFGEGGGD
jgi:hypothetical protein